jgi:hypothetical protein
MGVVFLQRISICSLHEIQPCNHLRHGMLHLQSSVNLDKEEFARRRKNEFDSTRAGIRHRSPEGYCCLANSGSQLRVTAGDGLSSITFW